MTTIIATPYGHMTMTSFVYNDETGTVKVTVSNGKGGGSTLYFDNIEQYASAVVSQSPINN